MRDLRRNNQTIWYAQYLGEEPNRDADGFEDGETTPAYSDPERALLNISPASGMAENNPFGAFTDYTHVIITAKELPFDESTVVWYEREPGAHEPNYKVVRVSKGLNDTAYALQAVNLDNRKV